MGITTENSSTNQDIRKENSILLFLTNIIAIELGLTLYWVVYVSVESLIIFSLFLTALLYIIGKRWNDSEIKYHRYLAPIITLTILIQILWHLLSESSYSGQMFTTMAMVGGIILAFHDSFFSKKSLNTGGNVFDEFTILILTVAIYAVVISLGTWLIVFGILKV